jgi:hypothetical protein
METLANLESFARSAETGSFPRPLMRFCSPPVTVPW